MSRITTHVLDTSLGRPAAGVPVKLEIEKDGGGWKELSRGATDGDGRHAILSPPDILTEGTYRLIFDAHTYFQLRGAETFYPQITVTFRVRDAKQNYHVPLLLAPYGYSTYRGS